MDGMHDVGGMAGFGSIPIEDNEPVFHGDWEGKSFAMVLLSLAGASGTSTRREARTNN